MQNHKISAQLLEMEGAGSVTGGMRSMMKFLSVLHPSHPLK